MTNTLFNDSEWLRYTRHIQLPQIGAKGQSRLKKSHVLIVGAGGLGAPVSLYLAAAGIGSITIIDGDTIELSNLQRQIIFSTEQIGQSKAEAAKTRLTGLNTSIQVNAISKHLSTENAESLIMDADLVIDCTDNFTTRYLVNDVCIKYQKPWLFASIYQFSGQCALFTHHENSACFRCLFPDDPINIADCNTAGVMGVLPGLLGTLQANEAIKYLTGLECPLDNHLMLVETIDLSFRKIQLNKNSDCISCSDNRISRHNQDSSSCEIPTAETSSISTQEWLEEYSQQDKYTLLDVRSDAERAAFHIKGAHIPLDQLAQRYSELPSSKSLICYCQTGIRSQKAVELLQGLGFNAKSLHGGLVEYLQITSTL